MMKINKINYIAMLLLSALILSALIPASNVAAQGFDSDSEAQTKSSDVENTVETEDGSVLTWREDGSNAVITGYVSLSENLVVPSDIEGRPVIALADLVIGSEIIPNFTFANCTQLETVVLPDTLRILSGGDFGGCTNLKHVSMPYTLNYMGMNAFFNCTSLESIDIPSGVPFIDIACFMGCSSLESISVPSSVRTINSGAFASCINLKCVEFNDGLESIGAGAFDGTALTRVDLPSGLSSIASTAFRSDTLEVAYIPATVDEIGEEAFGSSVIILTDVNANRVRSWAMLNDMVYIAGTLDDYNNPRRISSNDYTGQPYEPDIVLRNAHYDLFPMNLAEIKYKDNINAGTASYTVTSSIVSGSYVGTFEIDQVRINSNNVTIAEIPTQQYVGIPLEPDVEITYGDELLVEGEDFTCSYSNNDRDSGTGLVTIEGIGNFKGNKRLYFSIVPGVWSDSDSDSDVQPVPDDEDSDITKPDDNPGTDDSTDSPSAETPGQQVKRITMHRLYNRWTGEHFYTASSGERDYLVSVGWTSEGTGWVAPESGGPVYRLYNPYVEGGDHHYTMDVNEYERLEELGWKQEGVGWRSGGEVKVYREYNPYATTGTHNYTPSENEHRTLVSLGWKDEGVGWYAVAKE